jgi:hypothetical protein
MMSIPQSVHTNPIDISDGALSTGRAWTLGLLHYEVLKFWGEFAFLAKGAGLAASFWLVFAGLCGYLKYLTSWVVIANGLAHWFETKGIILYDENRLSILYAAS